jgi:hypothetical protein
MRRRTFLTSTGAVLVCAAAGGAWRADEQGVFSTGEGPAYQPWKTWQVVGDHGPLAVVAAAILAASPHNTQPWLFKLADSQIDVYADTPRNTGALDPYLREQHIGLGCALENLTLAALHEGLEPSVTLLPGKLQSIASTSGRALVARVHLTRGDKRSSDLYNAIPRRHTNRNPYEMRRPVPSAVLGELNSLVGSDPDVKLFLFANESDRPKIIDMIDNANSLLYADPEVERDSDQRWVRMRWSDVQKFRDGLSWDDSGQPPLAIDLIKMSPLPLLKATDWYKRLRYSYREVLSASPVFGLIALRDRYDRAASLRAGCLWQRIHLTVTARGLAARPVNEAVELIDHQLLRNEQPWQADAFKEITGDAAWQPTFMFRMGYPVREAPPSARRPVQAVVI